MGPLATRLDLTVLEAQTLSRQLCSAISPVDGAFLLLLWWLLLHFLRMEAVGFSGGLEWWGYICPLACFDFQSY